MDYKAIVDNAILQGLVVNDDGTIIGVSGKQVTPRASGVGYQCLALKKIGEIGYINVYWHRIVYYYFSMDTRTFEANWNVHHKDGNRQNNALYNLELKEAYVHYSGHHRLNTNNARMTYDTAEEIRSLYRKGGISQTAIAKMYGVVQQHISDILSGKKWGDKMKPPE